MTIGEFFQRLFQGFVNIELAAIGSIILVILIFGSIYLIGQKYFDWLGNWVEKFRNPFIKFVVYIILSVGVLALIFLIIIIGFLYSEGQL